MTMTYRALVVDDDREIIDIVDESIESLGHEHDDAMSQEEGRERLFAAKHDYYLLDLGLPLHRGRGLPRIQNGENLLAEICDYRHGDPAPIIVMTGYGLDSPDLAVQVMKLGATDYITKPFPSIGKTLDNTIRDALARQYGGNRWRLDPGSHLTLPTPVHFQGGDLVFHEDRVELCGVTVVEGQTRIRRVLDVLRERRPSGRYMAVSGTKLAAMLGTIGGENAISEAIKGFRDVVVERLELKGIACGRKDVLLSGGSGYRLAEWIIVRDGDDYRNCRGQQHAQTTAEQR